MYHGHLASETSLVAERHPRIVQQQSTLSIGGGKVLWRERVIGDRVELARFVQAARHATSSEVELKDAAVLAAKMPRSAIRS